MLHTTTQPTFVDFFHEAKEPGHSSVGEVQVLSFVEHTCSLLVGFVSKLLKGREPNLFQPIH